MCLVDDAVKSVILVAEHTAVLIQVVTVYAGRLTLDLIDDHAPKAHRAVSCFQCALLGINSGRFS